ncbi:hypothetical protein J2W55_005009 [Mucilaginibacter pocheonensis]|uniref:Uncharacterized protein n=1 Tax=Mucilaginibacter pocheonensis TaxID=398050 RepID=A0ABU1TIA8_9SPHI|nr:hypothetical protein [Mucilaginibacter pocheonensis]
MPCICDTIMALNCVSLSIHLRDHILIKQLLVTNTTLRTAITALANPHFNYPGIEKLQKQSLI